MKELAPDDASIASYSDFESEDFLARRLRRRASGGNLVISAGGATPEASDRGAVRSEIDVLRCRFEIGFLRLSAFQNFILR